MALVALLVAAIWFLTRPPWAGPLEVAAAALLAAYGLTPAARLVALGWGVLDTPEPRKSHRVPTPKLGGTAVVAAFVLVTGRRVFLDVELLAIVICALILMAAGALDDTRGLPAWLRLGLQTACALTVMGAGVRLRVLPEFAGALGTAGDFALTLIWIIGITNAYNFIDGIDGLAATLGGLIALLLAMVALDAGQASLVLACAALAGALLGFLPHNLRPGRAASIFLGDSGSGSVGFLLAALAVQVDWAEGDPLVALTAPVLIFSVLIYDMLQTTVSRVASGRVRSFRQWIDYTGRDHIHHRLSAVLGGPRRALALILTLALGLGLSALGLRHGSNGEAVIFLVHATLILLVVEILLGAARRVRGRSTGDQAP
jgi:UDP-GlcNAc:undecaprenyl-phosphate GlcNAc-1-phosphate transferase